MEESLKNLYAETMNLIKQYGNCLLKDPNVSEKDWNDLSSFMMYICDESLKQDETFKSAKSFKQEILPDLIQPEDFDEESVMFQYQSHVLQSQEKLMLGRSNNNYKEFEKSILSKIPKERVENDVTAVSENLNLVDPITKLRLIDPVKNSVCGHVYEKATIMQLLNTKNIIKCPIPGCVAATKVMKKDLVPHTDLKKYLEENH